MIARYLAAEAKATQARVEADRLREELEPRASGQPKHPSHDDHKRDGPEQDAKKD